LLHAYVIMPDLAHVTRSDGIASHHWEGGIDEKENER